MTDAFDPIAAFYDELMKSVPYRMWVGYLLLLHSTRGAKPKSLLDVCCGTGTMCSLLYQEGFEVAGFDLSPEMIAEARYKAEIDRQPIQYEVANAASVDLGREFEGAYSFFDSLNYILDPQDLASAFRSVARHLPSGGVFVFDLNTRYAFEERMFDQRSQKKNARVRYQWRSHWDPDTLLVRVNMKFWVDGEEHEAVHHQRAHPDEEVRAYLADAGFGEVSAYHSYTLDPPRSSSDRVHYVAVKR